MSLSLIKNEARGYISLTTWNSIVITSPKKLILVGGHFPVNSGF